MTGRIGSFLLICLCALVTIPAFAADDPLARMNVSGSNVWFDPVISNVGFLLSVAGPDGLVQESRFAAGETPFFSPQLDGLYQYELRVISATQRVEGAAPPAVDPTVQSGSFQLVDGAIVSEANQGGPENALVISEGIAETLSTSTIQDINPRLYFDDTTSDPLFPVRDWALVANDSNSGGATYFAIQDTTAATVPFRVDGDSPSNSLFVESSGDVGIGTSNPMRDLQITRSWDPAIRLNQTAIGQSWDMVGSELGFQLIDSTLDRIPFRVMPGAPNNSLRVSADGYVGLGLSSPGRLLHLRGANAVFRMDRTMDSAAFLLCRTDGAGNVWKGYIVGVDSSAPGVGQFIISDSGQAAGGASVNRMTIQNDGWVVFPGNVLAAGYFVPSSIALKTNVRTLNQATDLVNRLRGVRFDWKSNGEPAVGMIAEEVEQVIPELVSHDSKDGKVTGVNYSSVVAVLVEAMKSQQQTIEKQQESIDRQEAELSTLKSELEKLKSRVN